MLKRNMTYNFYVNSVKPIIFTNNNNGVLSATNGITVTNNSISNGTMTVNISSSVPYNTNAWLCAEGYAQAQIVIY